MKTWLKLLLCSGLALLLGLAGGFALHRRLPPRSASALTSQLTVNAPSSAESQSEGDSLSLVRCALEAMSAIKQEDYSLLATYVQPDTGVTFTPAATVDLDSNLTFSPDALTQAADSEKTFVWGTSTRDSTPIKLTLRDYFASYVWDRDYAASPRISVDTAQVSGNAMENTLDAYSDCHYVEFYCTAAEDPSDWTTLRLVFQWYSNDWYLVGVIHSAWNV